MKTWIQIQADLTIDCIEHPITGFLMPKEEFSTEFELVLKELDGTTASDYFDFYLDRCPIIRSAYRFRDSDAKEDFIDACIDLGLLPTFKETLQGECSQEQLRRQYKSSEDLLQDFKSLKSKEMSKKYHSEDKADRLKYRTKSQQLYESFRSLNEKLERLKQQQASREKIQKIEEKVRRVVAMMEHSM